MFLFSSAIYAQSINVRGTVTNENGEPLSSASVKIKDSKTGTLTEENGSFSIKAPQGSTLVFTALGYITVEKEASEQMNITLTYRGDAKAGDDVLVIAYGTQQRKDLTSAIATVSAKDIERQQVTTVGQTLQGLAPGVLVINTTGQPGENPVIRIRGIGSINASADPLIVVDGVPYYGNLNTINTNDIASLNVLKDASATALYGSRAANGVILINTKRGTKGTPKINVYGSMGWSKRAVKEYKFVSPEDYLKITWEALKNTAEDNDIDNPGQWATDNLITGQKGLKYNPYNVKNPIDANGNLVAGAQLLWNTDWTKALANDPAQRKNVGVSVSGASDVFNYFLSADYLNQEGYIINSNFKRVTARFNGEANLTKWLNLGLNMSISSSTQNYPTQSGSAFSSAVAWGRIISSIYPLYMRDGDGNLSLDADGNPQYDYGFKVAGQDINSGRPVASGSNAVGQRILDKDIYDRLQPSINTFAEIKFTDYLKFKSTFGSDWYLYSSSNYGNPLYGDAAAADGRYGEEKDLTSSYTWNNMLSYDQSFGQHKIGVMASYEAFNYHQSNLFAQKAGFSVPDIYDLGAYANYENAGSPKYDERLLSYLGRVTYNFADKYIFEGTIRRDGSTRFSPSTRWGTFYSLAASWNITNEKFMQNINWLNQLKLRGSYGEVGNNSLGSYFPYLTTYETGYNDIDQSGVYIPSFADPNITWEKLGTYNIGIDFAVLNNRLTGSIDYYNKNTFDLLGDLIFAPSTGITGITTNIGSIRNSGIEVSLTSRNIVKKDFTWETTLNFGTVKNRITKQSQDVSISGSFRRKVGVSLYQYYITEWAGVNPENGLPQWYADETDDNGKVTGKKIVNTYAEATRYDEGSALAKVNGGLNNSIRYKNIDFSFLINGSFGGKILDQDYISLMSRIPTSGYQYSADILNRWQKSGDVTDVPRLTTTQNDYGNASTRQLVSGDYMRLRNVTLGYTVPAGKWFKNDVIKTFRFYLQADNYLTWKKAKFDGLDPEVGLNGTTGNRSTPFKTMTLGVNLGF